MTRYTLHSLQIYGREQDTCPLLTSQISTLLVSTFYNFPLETDFTQFPQSLCLDATFTSMPSVNEVFILFSPVFSRSISASPHSVSLYAQPRYSEL